MRILLLLCFLTRIGLAADPPSVVGDWDGVLNASDVQPHLVLHIQSSSAQHYTATLDSVDQGANGIRAENVTVRGDSVAMEFPVIPASYKGVLSANDGTLSGTWVQGASTPLTFKKRPANFQAAKPSAIDGRWVGLLAAGQQKLHVAVRVIANPDGTLSVWFYSLDQTPAPLAAENVHFDGATFSFDVPAARICYEGALSADNSAIDGTFTQGGRIPLDLRREEKPVAEARPQEPKPPFPYKAEPVRYAGGANGVQLAGTLTEPKGTGPFPAMLLIPGSGPHDRDETLFGHKPFLLLADTLTRHGLAVLRYDDRGVGESTGDLSKATSVDLAADATAGVRYLRSLPEIDQKHIGLLGHSEGALIALMMASEDPRIAFLVLLGAPAVRGDQVILAQDQAIAQAAGVPEEKIRQSHETDVKILRLAQEGKTGEEIRSDLKAKFPNLSASTREELSSPWYHHFLSYDPANALTHVHCPVLALYGAKDLQAVPEQNVPAVKADLAKAGDRDVKVEVLPNLNHLLQDCRAGLLSEYGSISETMSPAALGIITRWVEAHTR